MLSLKERSNVLEFLQFFCICNPLPVQVDTRICQVHSGAGTKLKAMVCKASYLLFIAHTIYNNVTLIHAIFVIRNVPLYQVILHAVFAFASMLYVYWYYILYVSHADVTAEFRSLTLSMRVAAGMM